MVMVLLSKFLHSKNDLRAASGLADDQEVDALFYALKEAAGNINSNDHVTFEEFRLGVVDFPFMLE